VNPHTVQHAITFLAGSTTTDRTRDGLSSENQKLQLSRIKIFSDDTIRYICTRWKADDMASL